jgi:hypothetical protein
VVDSLLGAPSSALLGITSDGGIRLHVPERELSANGPHAADASDGAATFRGVAWMPNAAGGSDEVRKRRTQE